MPDNLTKDKLAQDYMAIKEELEIYNSITGVKDRWMTSFQKLHYTYEMK